MLRYPGQHLVIKRPQDRVYGVRVRLQSFYAILIELSGILPALFDVIRKLEYLTDTSGQRRKTWIVNK